MTFSIDNPEGGCNNPPLGKYVWEKPSEEQGLKVHSYVMQISLQNSGGKVVFLGGPPLGTNGNKSTLVT